ncbi:transmembrane protein, putative (macronuclear) [Tetrahymena thermophila SB210]|uniref:Transmembrane protein, putative n=1 Tax=Tetrahymena thermophila (strain SB210) TaxID=312017 RepID=Q22R56_TETTS|nr:transmembrane protein, putative [Tetrahymena thermophila SB210]EAR88266.2 transmembrane protein, putative [Tetrahymena thermophila SB210]|eukprot:XP_001008511.2 transmembrane protein, putative [Tetrahymena thermophila SB210]
MRLLKILFQESALFSLLIALVYCLRAVKAGQIFGQSIVVDYNYDGYAQKITLLVQFESSLGNTEAMQIQFPTSLGPSNQVFGSIYEDGIDLLLAGNVVSDSTSQNNYYIFAFNANLKANVFYRIEITFVNQIINNLVFNDPISMFTMSQIGSNSIIYDSNPSLFYLYIAPNIPNETLIVNIQLNSKPQEEYITDPGIIYSSFIDITPSISNSQGGYYYVYIDVGPNIIGSTNGADFQFVGKCQSVENKCDPTQNDPNCININQVKSNCTIDSQTGRIQFIQKDPIIAQQPIRINVEIKNPLYVSQRDIKVYSASINDKRPMEKGRLALALRVTQVQIQVKKIQYLWGVDQKESIFSPYKLFKAASATPLAGPINSFQIYFTIPTIVPEGSDLTLSLETDSTSCLEHSIITNLPVQSGKQKVSCYFTIVSTLGYIKCVNIGAFQDPSIQYFIAAKVYYANSAPDPVNFGGISIKSVVLDGNGQPIPNINLFGDALGQKITLQANTEYLDTSGWHSSAAWSLGTTQIISTPDDGTLSGVPNGINALLTGQLNTVGIIPSLQTSQQLIFFLKVTPSQIGTDNNYYRMSILYNPSVVKYVTGYETKGIDFAAYSSTNSKWELDQFVCYSQANKQCVWYNKPQLQANTIEFTYNSLISNPYAFVRFECGLTTAGVPVSTCNNFQGQGTANTQAGALSMRNVYFDSGFQSSIYPDDKLLDFIITFEQKKFSDPNTVYTTVSTQLINAYTIQNYRLSNIKVSYINLYSQSSGTIQSNNGFYVPTMLRIGGSILRSESLNLDKIHVFLDENVDASNFMENYSTDQSDHSIGCSQATCQYFANSGAFLSSDTWFNQKKIEITNLPNIQNEFNILIPITNLNGKLPIRLVIAFTSSQNTVFGLGGLDKVLNAFRVAGLPVYGKLQSPIPTMNGIANNVAALSGYTALWAETGNTFNYKMDITNVGVQSTVTQTSLAGDATTKLVISQPTDAQMYGAGLTITSFSQNIFSISQIQFSTPPSTGAQSCTTFQYKINTNTAPQERQNQYNYVVYCPIDDYTYKIDNTATPSAFSIIIKNPSFPGFFVNGYDLSTVFSYAFSNNKGSLIAFNVESQTVATQVATGVGAPWACTTNTVTQISPSSTGRQKLQFVIQWNNSDLKIDSTVLNGYASLDVKVTFTDITGLTFLVTATPKIYCQNDQFSCEGTITGNSIDFILKPLKNNVIYTIERSQNIVITTFLTVGTPASSLKYNIDILIPTQKTGKNYIYGDSYNNIIYQQCAQNPFVFSANPYGNSLEVTDISYEILNQHARGTFSFNFKSISAREEFYSTSQYIFTLGFMASADNISVLQQNSIFCYVMERDYTTTNSPFQVSHRWKTLQIAPTFATITLTPQDFFVNPQNYQFKVVCVGGVTTDGVITTGLTAAWKDGSDTIQQTAAPVLSGNQINPQVVFTNPPTIVSRLFASPGMEAHYKFKIQIKTPLTVQSRIYIDFGIGFSPRINKNGHAECYITDSPTFDIQQGSQTLTLCEIINSRRLKVYANDLVSSLFYIDVLGVSMPQKQPAFAISRPVHWIGVDDDGDLTNGIVEQGTFLDTFPSSITSFSVMSLLNIQQNTNIIRRAHSLNFTIQTQRANILSTNLFYIDFPYQYDSITRGDNYPCTFQRNNLSTYPKNAQSYVASPNLALKCDFISKRRMRITINKQDDQTQSSTYETYSIFVQNIVSPSQVVSGLRFTIFASDSANLNAIILIAQDYSAGFISYVAETEKTDLQWNSIQLQQSQQNVVLTTLSYLYNYYSPVQYFNAYIGFYNCDMQLQPKSNTQNVFKNTFQYSFNNYISNFYFDNITNYLETAFTGQAVSQFKLAAQQSTSPGIYTLHPIKSSGDTLQQYMDLPPLNVVVSTNKCQINAASNAYNLPADGQTLPIIFDFTNCYPAQSIQYIPTNDLGDPTQLVVDQTTYQDTVDGSKGNYKTNYRMIMIFKPKSSNLIPVGTVINLSFNLGGYNLLSYNPPNNVQLTVTAALGSISAPVAAGIVIVSQQANTIVVQFSCDQPSIVLYQVGLEDNTPPAYTAIITQLTSARDFFSDNADYQYFKQYGRLVIPVANGNIQQTITNLQSSSVYNIYYYCLNQQPQASAVQTASFQVTSNQGYLLKINLYFSDMITYAQNQDIACAMTQAFSLNSQRIVTDQDVQCGGQYPYFVKTVSSQYKKQISVNKQYQYSYYILPDKTLVQDLVNLQIKEIIQYSTFNLTLLSNAQNPQLFPLLLDTETEDILTQSQVSASLNVASLDTNYATLNFTLIGQKGYIYIGIMAGSQNIQFQNFLQLVNYNNLLYFWSSYVPRDILQTVTFTNLQPQTTYTVFYAATNDNPSIQAQSTGVQTQYLTTKAIQVVVEAYSAQIIYSLFILAFYFLI